MSVFGNSGGEAMKLAEYLVACGEDRQF